MSSISGTFPGLTDIFLTRCSFLILVSAKDSTLLAVRSSMLGTFILTFMALSLYKNALANYLFWFLMSFECLVRWISMYYMEYLIRPLFSITLSLILEIYPSLYVRLFDRFSSTSRSNYTVFSLSIYFLYSTLTFTSYVLLLYSSYLPKSSSTRLYSLVYIYLP